MDIVASVEVPNGSVPLIEDGRLVGYLIEPGEEIAEDTVQELDDCWVDLGYLAED